MTAEQQYFISLSKAAVFGETPPTPPQELDWKWMLDKSMEQNITGLLASAIDRLPDEQKPANYKQWHLLMLQTVMIMSRKADEFERMAKILTQNGIEFIVLKGMAVKSLYGKDRELLRTMGDFDILIESKARKKSERIFEQEGYTIRRDTLFIEVSKGDVNGELFESLEAEFKHEPKKWNDILKNNVINTDGKCILNPTYELAFSVIHTAKHLLGCGCGLRNILDAVLILKHRKNIDFNRVYEACKAQGCEKILSYIISITEQWYDVPVNADIGRTDCEKILEYLLDSGVFGYSENGNALIQQVAKQGGQSVGALRRIFFPPREMIAYKYQYVKKSPLLLPVAWVHRFFYAVFRRKYSIRKMCGSIKSSIEFAEKHRKMMESIDIYEEDGHE